MTAFSVYFGIILLLHFTAALSTHRTLGFVRCINVWDEGCVGGQLPGAGRDDDFLTGGSGPGKRGAPPHHPHHPDYDEESSAELPWDTKYLLASLAHRAGY